MAIHSFQRFTSNAPQVNSRYSFPYSSPQPGYRKNRERDGIPVRDGIGKGAGFQPQIPQSLYPNNKFCMQYSKSAKSTTLNYLLLPLLLINIIASPNMMIYHHINGTSELLHLQCSLLAHLLQYNPTLGQKRVATTSYV